MKRFIIKLFLFFVIIFLVDFVFGCICQYMNDHSKGGGVKSRYYVCKQSDEDILIFGSSRAKHHYVPEVIEEIWGSTCYNTGEDGNGIIYSYGVLRMITNRYSPKFIIYDVSEFDLYKDDNAKYLDLLKPYYYENGIDSIFWHVKPTSRIMMLSGLYRFNTSCIRIFGNYLKPMTCYPKGYEALNRTMSYEPLINRDVENKEFDNVKLYYFERFIELARNNGISVICCVSPSYKFSSFSSINDYSPIQDLCDKHKVAFLFYGDDPEISNSKNLFQDRTHLNDTGARIYTKKLLSKLLYLNQVFYSNNQ